MSEGRSEALRRSKADAKSVIRFLADEPKASRGEIFSQEGLGRYESEMYARFGSYDAASVQSLWDGMLRYPSLLKDPELKAIAIAANRNDWIQDVSFIGDVLNYVDPVLVPIKKLAAELNKARTTDERRKGIANLKAALTELLKFRPYTLQSRYEEERPLMLEDFERESLTSVASPKSISGELSPFAEAIQNANFEMQAEELLGTLDKEKLRREILKFGAKGAHLDILESLIEKIENFGVSFTIPDYQKVPVSVYDVWKKDGDILKEAQALHTWANGRAIIVRSSAVYSEDAEDATGAGIYDSITIEAGASVGEIVLAMQKVYESVESSQAIAYRKQKGIGDEKMGLVVQEFIDTSSNKRGYANTALKNVPELMEIAYANGFRSVIDKQRAQNVLRGGDEDSIFHFQVDIRRKSTVILQMVSRLMVLLEKYYAQPVQIEFLEEEGKFGMEEINLVQARFLPKSFSEKKHMEFPEGDALFAGRAVGIFDVTLPVLLNRRDNSEKEGVVLFNSSKYFSDNYNNVSEETLPAAGGVVVLGPSPKDFGHVETLAAEKGLALVFDDGYEIPNSRATLLKIQMRIPEGVQIGMDNLDGYRTLRLVSDGLEGRVYGVGERSHDDFDTYDDEPQGL